MDILFLCAYASFCGIIIYWKIIRPWNAARHLRRPGVSVPPNVDVVSKAIPVHGQPRKVGQQERDIAHFRSDDIPCKGIDRKPVTLIDHGSGAMFPDPEIATDVARNAWQNPDFMTAPIGLVQQRLAEIQMFCSTPRAKQEIESRFPGVEVSSLRDLGILSEVCNIGRLGEYVWSGSKPEFINRQEDRPDRTPRQINNPAPGASDNLGRPADTSGDDVRRRGSQTGDDMNLPKPPWNREH
jgi:hypothetical protein